MTQTINVLHQIRFLFRIANFLAEAKRLSMQSVTFSKPLCFSQSWRCLDGNKELPFEIPRILISYKSCSTGALQASGNRNWVFRRKRFPTKSAKSETDTDATASLPDNNRNPTTNFLSILCPLLKLFGGGDPSQERNDMLEAATSTLSSLARFPWGSKSLLNSSHSQGTSKVDLPMPLQLFEFEACPFCRRVREAMTELDLSVEIYPCPKGSVKHRDVVRRIGGKELFPFLVDPNTGVSMYESGDIVKYLFQQYGQGSPSVGLLESTLFTGWMPTILRAGRGMTLWEKSKIEPPLKKLELFSYENNPYARIVREALCELELPYVLQNVGEGSSRLKLLMETSGSEEVPYLIDPNTGTQLGDYKKILSYLFRTYCKDD